MIPRQAQKTIERLARGFPILALTGPRQSGKTTLARAAFAQKPYVSLESPDERAFAIQDPKRFLSRFPNGAVIDEIQRVPPLLSWLQSLVDERHKMADFIITGSAQFDLMAGITQSLAGRVGRIELLPFASSEAKRPSLDGSLLTGGYPPLYDREVTAQDWFPNYVSTYLERDVRQLLQVRDLLTFQRFVQLCAARSGQLLNLSSLGSDCGISSVTAKQWLSVLETSYLVTLIQPYHRNFGKRLVKSPKLYFLDSGLMAWLLGLRSESDLSIHHARGAIFETWVISDLIKQRYNQGKPNDLFFWRDSSGNEVDLVFETKQGLQAIEIKSGSTWASDWLDATKKWQQFSAQTLKPILIYGGNESLEREQCQLIAWSELTRV